YSICAMKSLMAALSVSLLFTATSAAGPVDYLRDVKPILTKNCYACHGPDKQRSGLRLDTAAAALKGGDSGPVIVPGKSAASKMVKAVAGLDDVKPMPPKGDRLSAQEIGVLRSWIDQGAKAPSSEVAAKSSQDKKKHWAFIAPVRPEPPEVR